MSFKMKYAITPKYLTKPSKRRSGIKMPRVGFVVAHDTGNDGSSAKDNINYYENSRNDMSASAHIFVDHTGIYECIPALTGTPEKAWHVIYNKPIDNQMFGDDANDVGIGVELCYSYKKGSINNEESYKRYVWLLAYICYKFKLDVAKSIVGHHILDPQRKSDPQNALSKMGKSYNQLLKDVVKEYYDCLSDDQVKEEIILKLQQWQIDAANSAIDSLSQKKVIDGSNYILNNPEDWKKKVKDNPEQIVNDMSWLFFVLLDRITK